jgi:serine/threonine protein kinase/Ca2+-binding EF-hand superfamily protein
MTETFDLSKIRKGLQIQDEELLNKYLKEIWSDLSKRTKDTTKGITKVTFNKYYDLPGIISERLFSCFDKDKDGILNLTEFTNGMQSLFSQAESFDSLAKFIFNLYDFNSSGIIKKDDVRVVLSYVPLSDSSSNIKENVELVKDKFEDRVESQEQLFHILNIAFKNKDKMNFEEYINVVKNINSDIFILLLMFLLEKKPFSNYSIQLHSMNIESPSLHLSATPQLIPQQIASPSLHSRFLSPKLRKKKLDKNKNKGLAKATNLLQLYSGVDNTKVKEEKKDKNKEESKDLKEKRPQRRMRINLNNLTDKTPELSKNTFTFGKDRENEDNKEDDNAQDDIEEENFVRYEGYVYKYSQTQKKMKRTYFRLIGKDLYYYKKKEEKNHRGMHNLSGVFIKKGDDFEYDGKKYLSIVIVYKSEKSYYFDNENDFNIWMEKLNAAVQNKSLFDKYEVKQKIGKGKFGLVKFGINKETKQQVAIKIMAKKNMDKSDLELAKVEIDILKIGQHPNIIKLYDIYENENYIYIIMEYCSGGDLLSYFEHYEYELKETKVCEIIHKLSMAIYYLHSYGIVHRDLKPENILMTDLTPEADIRLLDFGLSKIVGNEEKCTEPYGTLSFVAPEVLQGKPYDKSVDLWSIGIITFLLLCGYLPFDDKHSEREIARQTIQDPVPFESKIWNKYSSEAKNFVEGLLQKKPEKRLTIKEILEHPWIKKMDKVPNKRRDTKKESQFGFYTSKND